MQSKPPGLLNSTLPASRYIQLLMSLLDQICILQPTPLSTIFCGLLPFFGLNLSINLSSFVVTPPYSFYMRVEIYDTFRYLSVDLLKSHYVDLLTYFGYD